MEYQTWTNKSSPTPAEKLIVCDKCQKAEWTLHRMGSHLNVNHCSTTGHGRMREGTPAEYTAARLAIRFTI